MIKIQIIYAKTCPACKIILREILLPLAMKFPNIVLLDIKESFHKDSITTVLMPGGSYYPIYHKTPEIVIGDKRYLVSKNITSILKLFFEIKKLLDVEIQKYPLQIRRMYSKTISEIYNKLSAIKYI